MSGAKPALRFGQVVIGPPGSGKTTYCQGMQDFLSQLGRKVVVVNMDPANEGLPYTCGVDISELVTLADVMEAMKLGPNGGLLYCMEYVEANLDWLEEKLKAHGDSYFLFDCPGQVELYTHQSSVKNIFSQLAKWNFRVSLQHKQGLLKLHPIAYPFRSHAYMSIIQASSDLLVQFNFILKHQFITVLSQVHKRVKEFTSINQPGEN